MSGELQVKSNKEFSKVDLEYLHHKSTFKFGLVYVSLFQIGCGDSRFKYFDLVILRKIQLYRVTCFGLSPFTATSRG